jgi:hypothetical protein
LAINAGVQLALLGRVFFREMRSPSIDEGLNLFRGQACRIDDRTVSQVGTIDSVWVYMSEADLAFETSQFGKVGEWVGRYDFAVLRNGVVCLAMRDQNSVSA